ncbi:MAG TPA: aminotransferase class V-fold PLP-dependent enzyme [Terriglobia bacterium]|nr:aminotransferase class V-fold PLP-dependent enzyme [Terriglobia bacterium]
MAPSGVNHGARNYGRDFPDFAPTTYLNCAYQGVFPNATVARVHQACELKRHPERLADCDYFDLPERVRARFARLTGAHPEEVALTNSATQGIGIAAAGLDLSAGEEVVVASCNFPSNLFTWLHLRRRGVRVSVLDPRDGALHLEDAARALSPRTRVLALDWVGYTTGVRIDLGAFGELAHRHGALFVVDGTQGVGAIELDVHSLPVDVLAVAGYKWLLGPYGVGFAYLRPDVQDRLDLQVVNWLSVEGSDDFDELPAAELPAGVPALPRAARIFDVPETANFLNLHASDASLEYVEEAGIAAVNHHCRLLIDRLAEGLRARGLVLSAAADAGRRSTILGFRGESIEATRQLHQRLKREHISVSLRRGIIRVSPYLYNTEADIDRLLAAIGL